MGDAQSEAPSSCDQPGADGAPGEDLEAAEEMPLPASPAQSAQQAHSPPRHSGGSQTAADAELQQQLPPSDSTPEQPGSGASITQLCCMAEEAVFGADVLLDGY